MLTLMLDLAVHNAFALYLWLREAHNTTEQEISYREFKQQIAIDVVSPHVAAVENKNKKASEGISPLDGRMIEVIGEDFSNHLLLPTLERQRIQCYLCKILDNSKQRKDSYCCTTCRVGFHPECFTAFHHQMLSQSKEKLCTS